jgi:hypothetical protein
MAISTYAELQTAIAEWLGRETDTSIITRAPDFIRLFEAKANRELRCNQMERRSTALVNMASDEPEYISLPLDFQTMRRVRLNGVDGKPRLQFVTGVQADELRTRMANVANQPLYFTIFGSEIELIPTPDQAYTLEMVYRANIPALSDSATSNWLLDLAPDAYLYGALLESAPYIKEDSRIQTWATGYKYAMDGLNQLAMDQTFNAGPLVMSTSGVTP